MIIKGHGISSTSNISKFNSYLFEHEKNEEINVLQGTENDIKNMFSDSSNLKNGCYHFIMSSKETLTKEQALKICCDISKEYGQDPKNAVIVNHQKQRTTNDSDNNHYHIILQSADPKTGKAYDFSFSKKRNEKISRLSELELGHNLIKGRHNKAVYHQLIAEGKTSEAESMKHLTEGDLPNSKYTSKGLEKGRKSGLDKAQETQAIKSIWNQSDSLKAFKNGLSENGYDIKPGTKENTYIIERDGKFIGSANRIIGMKKEDFNNKYKELSNDEHIQKGTEKADSKISLNDTPKDPETYPETSEISHTNEFKTDRDIRKNFTEHQSEDRKKHVKNTRNIGHSRDGRTESTHENLGRNQREPIDNNRKIEQELKREDIKLQIKNYRNQKYKERKEDNYKDDIEKMIDILFNKLFKTPTKSQLNSINRLIKSGRNGELKEDTLSYIVNHELKKLTNINEKHTEKDLKNIYSDQSKFIDKMNKHHKIQLPKPDYLTFLYNNKDKSELCKKLFEQEKSKSDKEKIISKIDKIITDKREKSNPPHLITDFNEIKKNKSTELFSEYLTNKTLYDEKKKELDSIKIRFIDKIFNKSKIEKYIRIEKELSEIEKNYIKSDDNYEHFKSFGNEISKYESDKRIKENSEYSKNWKVNNLKYEITGLEKIKEKIEENDSQTIDNLKKGKLFDILKIEVDKIKKEEIENKKREIEKENIDNQKKEISQKTPKNSTDSNVIQFKR